MGPAGEESPSKDGSPVPEENGVGCLLAARRGCPPPVGSATVLPRAPSGIIQNGMKLKAEKPRNDFFDAHKKFCLDEYGTVGSRVHTEPGIPTH